MADDYYTPSPVYGSPIPEQCVVLISSSCSSEDADDVAAACESLDVFTPPLVGTPPKPVTPPTVPKTIPLSPPITPPRGTWRELDLNAPPVESPDMLTPRTAKRWEDRINGMKAQHSRLFVDDIPAEFYDVPYSYQRYLFPYSYDGSGQDPLLNVENCKYVLREWAKVEDWPKLKKFIDSVNDQREKTEREAKRRKWKEAARKRYGSGKKNPVN